MAVLVEVLVEVVAAGKSVLVAPFFFLGEGLLMASAGRAETALAFEAGYSQSLAVSPTRRGGGCERCWNWTRAGARGLSAGEGEKKERHSQSDDSRIEGPSPWARAGHAMHIQSAIVLVDVCQLKAGEAAVEMKLGEEGEEQLCRGGFAVVSELATVPRLLSASH